MHRLGSLIPLALGLVWIVYALKSFPLGGLSNPGPALWPVMTGAVLALTATVLLVTERDNDDYEPLTKKSVLVALGAGSTAVFIVLFEQVGFIVAGFLLMLFWCRKLGHESWRLSLAVSAGVVLLFYEVFDPLFGVPLPSGIFS